MNSGAMVQIQNVTKTFQSKSHHQVLAVDDVTFQIEKGETLGLIGESGSGKSTLGRLILGLIPLTKGELLLDGKDISQFKMGELKPLRKDFQIIFQEASYAMDPRKKVGELLKEPFRLHQIVPKQMLEKEVMRLLDVVGLPKGVLEKYPHEFSGGEKQRITIAKALSTRPKFIVCDEPLSALDVSVQAKIINLLTDIKKEFHLTYLFISHNMQVVHYISDRIAVIYKGKIVEIGSSEVIYTNPEHAYTKSLIAAYRS